MKRYEPMKIFPERMTEIENGEWLKYEDVHKLMRSLLNVFSGMSNEISDEEIDDYINGRV